MSSGSVSGGPCTITSCVSRSSCTAGQPVSPLSVPLKRSHRAMTSSFRRGPISQVSARPGPFGENFTDLLKEHPATLLTRQATSRYFYSGPQWLVPTVQAMGTRNTDNRRASDIDPYAAVETLRAALDEAAIILPS